MVQKRCDEQTGGSGDCDQCKFGWRVVAPTSARSKRTTFGTSGQCQRTRDHPGSDTLVICRFIRCACRSTACIRSTVPRPKDCTKDNPGPGRAITRAYVAMTNS